MKELAPANDLICTVGQNSQEYTLGHSLVRLLVR